MGRYILGVVDFGKNASSAAGGPVVSDSYFEWAFVNMNPNLPNGRSHLSYTGDGLYQSEPPRTFPACKAATLGDSVAATLGDPGATRGNCHEITCELGPRVGAIVETGSAGLGSG